MENMQKCAKDSSRPLFNLINSDNSKTLKVRYFDGYFERGLSKNTRK